MFFFVNRVELNFCDFNLFDFIKIIGLKQTLQVSKKRKVFIRIQIIE